MFLAAAGENPQGYVQVGTLGFGSVWQFFCCGKGLVFPAFCFLHLHGTDFAGKAEQVNEPFRIMVVIQIAGSKGGDAFVV